MTVGEFLVVAVTRLTGSGIGTARLDALVLLEDFLGHDRVRLLAHPEIELEAGQVLILNEQVKRRARHIPLAYIRGKTEFYGREFIVNRHVLEPRPESELMIDLLKFLPQAQRRVVADIGCGSGALAITAKLDLPDTTVYAVDIDANCLDIARRNAAKLKADIHILRGDLAAPLAAKSAAPNVLLCNLPYVPDSFQINTAATHEPKLAIFGGPDGLDLYRQLFTQVDAPGFRPAYILTEALPPQHKDLQQLADAHGYKMKNSEDFIQVFAAKSV